MILLNDSNLEVKKITFTGEKEKVDNFPFVGAQLLIILFSMLVIGCFLLSWIPIQYSRFIAVSVPILQILLEIKNEDKPFLTSPTFLLGCITVFFFCFLQGMYVYLPEIPRNVDTYATLHTYATLLKSIEAVGGTAERYIASFSMLLFITHAVSIAVARRIDLFPNVIKAEAGTLLPKIFFISLIFITTINLLYFHSYIESLVIPYKTIRSISPPIQAIMIVYLIRHCGGKTWFLKILLIFLILFILAGMFAVREGKIPVFIGLAVSFYWLRLSNTSVKRQILTISVLALIMLGGIQLLWAIKLPTPMPNDQSISTNFQYNIYSRNKLTSPMQIPEYLFDTEIIPKVLILKLIWRQTDSVNCLNNVLLEHWQQNFDLSKQFFWVYALVPRILWAGKPSLSHGNSYSYQYCDSTLPKHNGHSASITLLGQPVVNGGKTGLFLHGAFLIIILSALTMLTRDPRHTSTVIITSLMPWLIDFDQDFAMYFANAIKFFVVMLPFIYFIHISEKKSLD